MTKLHELREKLAERNLELEDMITQVQRVAENMAEITRQQEILTAKMRVHNKMGNCLLSARQYLAQELPREKKPQFLDLWQDSLKAVSYTHLDVYKRQLQVRAIMHIWLCWHCLDFCPFICSEAGAALNGMQLFWLAFFL